MAVNKFIDCHFHVLLLEPDCKSRKSIQLRRWFKEPAARGIYSDIANIFSIKYVIYPNVGVDFSVTIVEAATKSYIRDYIILGFGSIRCIHYNLIDILRVKNGV